MTKKEAIIAMKEGKLLTHKYFSKEEWVTIIDGQIHFEDGVSCSEEEFWKYRTDWWWNDDWKLFEY